MAADKEELSNGNRQPTLERKSKPWWLVTIVVIAGVLIAGWVFMKREPGVKATPVAAELTCNNPEGENPHSAIFKISLPQQYGGDNSKFTLDFGDGRPERKVNPALILTHYYEIPGRYYAILKYDSVALDTAAVYLHTNGWTATATMERDTVRVYPVNSQLLNAGTMHVTSRDVHHAGVDTNRTFFVHFVNTKPLPISGDNFELIANITTSQPRPGVRCSQVNMTVYGETSEHTAILMKPGCVSWARLRFSDFQVDGQTDDLSSIGADLTAGGVVKLQVAKKKVRLLVNEKTVYETAYNFPLKKIYGVRISFSGIGSVNDFIVKDLHSGETFAEGFTPRE